MVTHVDYAFIKVNTLYLFFIANNINKYKWIIFAIKFVPAWF